MDCSFEKNVKLGLNMLASYIRNGKPMHWLKLTICFAAFVLLASCHPKNKNNTTFGSDEILGKQAIERISLTNKKARFELTPYIGGRGLFYGLQGKENIIKTDENLLALPVPLVSLEGENIGYLGHTNWVGPQSEWWTQQTVNPARLASKAQWPPDPYTVLATTNIIQQSESSIQLQLPASPVTGLSLLKTFTLNEDGSLLLDVKATNTRASAVTWDIWFNTRLDADTTVYIPVISPQDIRTEPSDNTPLNDAIELQNGFFTLQPDRQIATKGKIFIQPAGGWMAAFTRGQLFIIEFEHLEKKQIHPKQGQVELYLDYSANQIADGLLEMEYHGALTQLQHKQTMASYEHWRVFVYSGDQSQGAQTAKLAELGYVKL